MTALSPSDQPSRKWVNNRIAEELERIVDQFLAESKKFGEPRLRFEDADWCERLRTRAAQTAGAE